MDDRREGSRRKKESRIWRRQGGRDEEKGFPLGWMKARENFPIPFPCSLFIVSGHNERYIQSSSRAYFWETRLNVYSQLRNRVGNALCCSSKAKEEKRTGMRNKKNEVAPEWRWFGKTECPWEFNLEFTLPRGSRWVLRGKNIYTFSFGRNFEKVH